MGKKRLGLLILTLMTLAFSVVAVRWIHYRLTHAISNAVFVESDSFTRLAFKRVAGRIVELYKEEGDRVREGEALAKIEDRDYRLKLEEVEKSIERIEKEKEALQIKAKALREEIKANLRLVDRQVSANRSRIEALMVKLSQLKKDRERFKRLFSKGVVPSRKFEEIDTQMESLRKEIESLEESTEALLAKKDVLRAKLKETYEIDRRVQALERQRQALLKKREDVENLLKETTLRSPVEGYVVKRYVSRGEVVRPGQYVYAVYNPEDVYVLVLLEETKLKGVREGNRAIVKIDAYPDEKFRGIVKEINRATAAKFALIPRDITAGEFTKVAQRIPVRIEITEGKKELLRVGMGGEVSIELSGD